MGFLRNYRELLLAGLIWLGAELASFAAIHIVGVRVVTWLPSGIVVAALLLFERRKWGPFLIFVFAMSVVIGLAFGLRPNVVTAHALINVLQPPIMVWIVRKLTRGLSIQALQLGDLVGFTVAIAVGSLVVVPIVLALQVSSDPVYLTYVAFATMLGTAVVAPIALTARDRLAGGKRACEWNVLAALVVTGALVFVLSLAVLNYAANSLLFLPTALIVFIVARHGQIGASATLFAFGLAASVRTFGGNSPAAFLEMTSAQAMVFLQFYMILLLAVSLPLAALLLSHDRLAERLSRRNRRLRQDLLLLSLAERLAGIGRWRHNLVTNEREMSTELRRMYGLRPDQTISMREGLAMITDGGVSLREKTLANRDNRHPYTLEFTIRRSDGEERFLRMIAVNEFDESGQMYEIFGVTLDMTDQQRREDALDQARKQAMRLASEAQLLAQTDALTGLANRRRTLSQLEKCIVAAREEKKALTVITFDVDHFKRVNDSHGHQTGDEVLKRVAELARQQVRESDVIGRTGGEEFVWILPGADEDVARSAAERLRQAIESHSAGGGLPGVTVSVGVATWREWEGPGDILRRADVALYDAKHNGRNQVSKAA